MNMLAECPSCGVSIKVASHAKIGEIIQCKLCKTNLEVVWLDPLELDLVYEPEESYQDYDYEDDYEDYDYEEAYED